MLASSVLVVFALILNIFLNCVIFWFFLGKQIKLLDAIKVSCAAIALNRLFFVGSGYAAMSYKLKRDDLPLHKSISSFLAVELFLVSPWLISGLYFGSKFALKIPPFFSVLLAALLILLFYKKKKAMGALKDAWLHFKSIRMNIFVILPIVLINFFSGILYYFFLLKAFGFTFSLTEILKVATVAFNIGYLSPAPSGLGFKESGLVFLLMQKDLSLKSSLSIALTDRALVTALYLILGFLFGSGIIQKEIKAFFKRNKK